MTHLGQQDNGKDSLETGEGHFIDIRQTNRHTINTMYWFIGEEDLSESSRQLKRSGQTWEQS